MIFLFVVFLKACLCSNFVSSCIIEFQIFTLHIHFISDVNVSLSISVNYPSLKLEDLLLRARYHFPMDNPAHAHTIQDNVLRWSSEFTGKTIGIKDSAVFTNGEPKATFLFNDTGCISDPKVCSVGITLSLWLKYTNGEAGQTFLSTGGNVDQSRGVRVFQLNGSFDHIAVEMRNELESCLWTFIAPQNIWSHFVIAFGSLSSGSCGVLKFFFNGELQSPLFSDTKSQNSLAVSPIVQIGDSFNGSPTAAFDDLVIWYEAFGDADISEIFSYYQGMFYYGKKLTVMIIVSVARGANSILGDQGSAEREVYGIRENKWQEAGFPTDVAGTGRNRKTFRNIP